MNERITSVGARPGLGRRTFEFLLELLPARFGKLGAPGLRCERGVFIKTPSRLILGRNVVLQRRALLHCGGKEWCDYGGGIELGDNVVVGPSCKLYGAGTIRIGAYSHLGPGSMVIAQCGDVDTADRETEHFGHVNDPIVLGKAVWIGAGAVILGGTNLGDNCVVGANSVVSGDYPAGTTLIGNPARPVRVRKSD